MPNVHLLLPCRSGRPQLETSRWLMQLATSGLVGAYSDEKGCAQLDLARAELLDVFLRARKADAAFMIDDDISSEEGSDLLKSMMAIDFPIVAMPYIKRETNDVLLDDIPQEKSFSRNGQQVLRIGGTGLGCVLIKRAAAELMVKTFSSTLTQHSQKNPWDICNLFLPFIESGSYLGDDTAFFRRARLAEIPVYTLVGHSVTHDGKPFVLRDP